AIVHSMAGNSKARRSILWSMACSTMQSGCDRSARKRFIGGVSNFLSPLLPFSLSPILSSLVLATILLLAIAPRLAAHPLAQGSMNVIVFRDHVTVWARVSVEEVIVQLLLPTRDDDKVETPSETYRAHGEYLLKHLFIKAD